MPRTPLASGRDRLGLLISVVAVGAVVWWASHQQPPHFGTSPQDLAEVAFAFALYAGITLLRAARWHVLLHSSHILTRFADSAAITTIGYMGNTVLPARGGELLRAQLVHRVVAASRREVLGTVVAERVLDILTLTLLFVGMTIAGVAGAPAGRKPAVIAGIALAVGAIGVAGYLRLRLSGRFERFASAVRPFVRTTRRLVRGWGAPLTVLSLAIWLLEGVVYLLLARSLGLHVAWLECTFVLVFASFFAAIPAAPGYAGTFDAAILFGMRALGVVGGAAVSFAILVRFVEFVPLTIAGLILLVARYGGLRRWLGKRTADAS